MSHFSPTEPGSRLRKRPLIAGLLLFATTPFVVAPVSAGQAIPPPPAATTSPADSLTLGDVLAMALAVSPRLEAARGSTAGARAQKRGAAAEGRPEVGLNSSGLFQGPERSIGGGPSITPNRSFEGNVDLSIPIYTGGRVKAGKKAASRAERAALAREEQEAQRLVLDVTEAYLGTLEAQEQTRVLAELRALEAERLRIGRVRVEAGVGAPLEVTEAEADLAGATQREIEAQAQLKQRAATLNTLIGRPAETVVALVPVPASAQTVAFSDGRASGDTARLTAEEARNLGKERPDLRAMREDVEAAEAGVDQARAARRPFVALRGNLLQRLPETLLGGFAWSLGSAIVQTLFDGGRSRAQVEAARATRQRAGANLKEAERLAEEQIEQTRVALEAAEQRQSAEAARVKAAEEALEVARKQVAAGIAPALRVTEAETVVTRARTDAVTARYAVARARAQLAYVIGRAHPQTVLASAS